MTRELNPESFLPDPAAWAFFFDLDGTLAPIAQRPDFVRVPVNTIGQLTRLHRAAGAAVAVISGRPLATLDVLLQPLMLPLGAEHGAIVRDVKGLVHSPFDCTSFVDALATELAVKLHDWPGILVERKAFGVAVHYRLAPDSEQAVKQLMAKILIGFPQFELMTGKMVTEAKLPGADKGRALSHLMQDPPFAGRLPLMVGDDTTDESAFNQANLLGGSSIKVGPGPTCAALRLHEQAALTDWLDTILRRNRYSPRL